MRVIVFGLMSVAAALPHVDKSTGGVHLPGTCLRHKALQDGYAPMSADQCKDFDGKFNSEVKTLAPAHSLLAEE